MSFKKTIAASLGLMMLAQGALAPRRAEASFAFEIASSVAWAIAMGWGGASLGVVSISHLFELKNASTGQKALRVAAAIVTGIGALILLDADPAGTGREFAGLSSEDARAAGLTDSEWLAYETERLEMSALAEQSVVDAERAVGTDDLRRFVEQVRANWDRDSAKLLSLDARAAAIKIARSSIR
jgi:hypothetical protein